LTCLPFSTQDFQFVEYLEHMMQSNMSNTLAYRRLVDVDFGSRYIDTCDAQLSYIHNQQGKSFQLFDVDIEGIAFVAAYLLVLLIKVCLNQISTCFFFNAYDPAFFRTPRTQILENILHRLRPIFFESIHFLPLYLQCATSFFQSWLVFSFPAIQYLPT
jgi:hypothetical protein